MEGVSPRVRVGTSGFQFDDWVGVFYPPSLPEKRRLEYYATFFDCLEVNSTYYRIPRPSVLEHMASRTPADFVFTVKLHRSITHDRAAAAAGARDFLEAVRPLQLSGKLGGLLAQFPWSFRNTKENRDHLLFIREQFAQFRLFVEFRHAGWATPGVVSFLQAHGLLMCSVDEPQLPGLMPSQPFLTGDHGYVRFHGRNAATWWSGGVSERYDYSYREEELRPWVGHVGQMASRAVRVFVFFNNCHAGQAARNALMMKRLLGLETEAGQGELFGA